jgi:flagellar biosynthesis repressor protein FlbT
VKKIMQISLRPGEKLYVNGAVLRVDRKVSIEFMNDVTFLLETHVTQPKDATTPLRQLYLIVQTMMTEPASGEDCDRMFQRSHTLLMQSSRDERIVAALVGVKELVERRRLFEALKLLRSVYPLEHEILSRQGKGGDTLMDAVGS